MPPPISDLLRSRGGQSRHGNNTNNGNGAVLPLHGNHHSISGTTSTAERKSTTSTISTNNFLLGGMYVPNKDKRKNFKRRRVMGYNKYSNYSIVSICQNTYVRYPFMILCVGFFVMTGMMISQQHRGENVVGERAQRWNVHNNHRRNNPQNNIDGLLQDETLSHRLPSIQEAEKLLTRFTSDRNKYQQLQKQQHFRFQLLEKLVPEWYHRNDPAIQKSAVESTDSNDAAEAESLRKTYRDADIATTKADREVKSILDDIIHVRPSSNRIRRTLQNNIHNMTQNYNQNRIVTATTSSCPQNLPSTNITVSLLIQSSMDRLWILHETCQRWKSPIIVVVAIPDDQMSPSNSSAILQKHMIQWKQSCSQLKVILYHLDGTTESTPESYPVNTLRNVALDAVSTSHILMMDIDFIPSQRLDSMIESALVEQQHASDVNTKESNEDTNHKVAMVIPAFDRVLHPPCTTSDECAQHLQTDSSFIPLDFHELQQCYNNDNCIIFQSMDNWEGHSSTRTELWLQQKWYEHMEKDTDTPSKKYMRTIPCFDSLRYEPYVVVRWCPSSSTSNNTIPVAPYYDERFHGYGKNKIQLISHLRLMGYRFTVLPNGGFIVHNPHVESSSKVVWNNIQDHSLHHTMDVLYQTFLNELVSIYLTGVKNGGTDPKNIVSACTKKDRPKKLE
jgi:Glycosyl-transferase for dystroglycan